MSIEGPRSDAENLAVANLVNSGVFVSVAAGNHSQNACDISPASAAGTVTAAASDANDTRATFSNYGACVDLYAPGVNVMSDTLNGGTKLDSGTSMASPHVAGVAALLKSDYGDQPSGTISNWILNAATTNAVYSNATGTPNRLLYMGGW
jgi:subtilisin family serine protease